MIPSSCSCPPERQGSVHSTMTVESKTQSTSRKSRSLTPTRSIASPTNVLVSKEIRWNAAKDAAEMGHFTRLREYVVESVSIPKEEVQDLFWVKSGLYMNTQRSSMFQIITEAAALGSLRTHRQKIIEIVTNDKSSDREDSEEDENDERNEKSIKRQFSSMDSSVITTTDDPTELVNTYVDLQRARKQKQLMDAEQFLERIEQNETLGEKWRTMELELPTSTVPRFRKPITYMTDGRLRGLVIHSAAEEGTARQERLVLQGIFKVHQSCKCVYCKHPTPFQTQSYQKLRMRQGWTDDSLETEQTDEEGAAKTAKVVSNHSSNRRASFSKSLSKRMHKRQTLASILSSTTAPGRSKSEPDPNIPSHFKANAASKFQIKAWKSRAVQAKRESFGKDGDRESHPIIPHLVTRPGGTWVSPRQRKEKLSFDGKSNLPKHDPMQDSPSTATKWDDTFLSPRSARKAKLNLRLDSASMHERSSKPAWAEAKLRRSTINDPQKRQQELKERQQAPAWAVGKDLLVPCSPQPERRKKDGLSMTEHSPIRGRLSPPAHRSLSFDGEVDEEALLHEELESLALESPQRKTVKQSLSQAMFTSKASGTNLSFTNGGFPGLGEDDDTGDEDDDDFAY